MHIRGLKYAYTNELGCAVGETPKKVLAKV